MSTISSDNNVASIAAKIRETAVIHIVLIIFTFTIILLINIQRNTYQSNDKSQFAKSLLILLTIALILFILSLIDRVIRVYYGWNQNYIYLFQSSFEIIFVIINCGVCFGLVSYLKISNKPIIRIFYISIIVMIISILLKSAVFKFFYGLNIIISLYSLRIIYQVQKSINHQPSILLQSMKIIEFILLTINSIIFILAIITWNKIHIYGLNCSVFLLYLLKVLLIITTNNPSNININNNTPKQHELQTFLVKIDEEDIDEAL